MTYYAWTFFCFFVVSRIWSLPFFFKKKMLIAWSVLILRWEKYAGDFCCLSKVQSLYCYEILELWFFGSACVDRYYYVLRILKIPLRIESTGILQTCLYRFYLLKRCCGEFRGLAHFCWTWQSNGVLLTSLRLFFLDSVENQWGIIQSLL